MQAQASTVRRPSKSAVEAKKMMMMEIGARGTPDHHLQPSSSSSPRRRRDAAATATTTTTTTTATATAARRRKRVAIPLWSVVVMGAVAACCLAHRIPVAGAALLLPSSTSPRGRRSAQYWGPRRPHSSKAGRTPSRGGGGAGAGVVVPLANSFMDDLFRFFDPSSGGSGSDDNRKNDESRDGSSLDMSSGRGNDGADTDGDGDGEEIDDAVPAGTTRIVSIPVKSIKPGGLRLFLMFYLLGQQNTPDKNTWKASQPSTEEYVLEFWFRDRSAVLTVTLEPNGVAIDRTGSSPSVSYLMQETSIVQGILDELQLMASDENIDAKDRLLLLDRPDSIQRARDNLAFS